VSATARIAAAVAGGYLLGRTKKLKLAITVGSMLAGQRISTNPRELLRQGAQLIESNPELSKLSDQVRSQLVQALRAAAVSTASDSMNQLSDAIHSRTERLAVTQGQNGSGEEAEDEAAEEPEEAEDEAAEEPEEAEDEEPEEGEPEDDEASDEEDEEEQPAARKRPANRSSGSDGGSSSRRSAQKKAPSKPSTAKKQASKKTTKQTSKKKSSASRSTKG
jgi:cobalamin biosynthesis protein CobT